MLLLFLLYLIYSNQIKKTKEKERTANQIAELKLQALRAQMNPHFIFNALTSIQYFFTKNDELSANKYMSDFSILLPDGANFKPNKKQIRFIQTNSKIQSFLESGQDSSISLIVGQKGSGKSIIIGYKSYKDRTEDTENNTIAFRLELSPQNAGRLHKMVE